MRIFLAISLLLIAFPTPSRSQQRQIKVPAGEVTTLETEDDITRISVAAPDIADYTVISKREILINGKKAGATRMNIRTAREEIAYSIEVRGSGASATRSTEPSTISGKVQKIINNPNVTVSMTDRGVIISGYVESESEKLKAEKVARAYLPNKEGDVTNVLDIRKRPLQVKMKVRVMEISENATKTYGINWGTFQYSAVTAVSSPANRFRDEFIMSGTRSASSFPRVVMPLRRSDALTAVDPFMLQISNLIDSGIIRILAEPNIVALSGARSEVLIGGQIPVPITTANSVSVTWRDYGIKMSLEPNIVDNNRVTAKIYTEISSLDQATAVVLNGSPIPGLKITQATSEINVEAGKTVFLSGLKRETITRRVSGIPGLSGLPIVGAVFGTHIKSLDKTDLIISVTPEIIQEGGL